MLKGFAGKVQGMVQGVGYRYFVDRTAHEHNIKGWVRNSSDGGVDVTAVGESADLEQFLLKLKKGPVSCRIETIDIDWLKDVPEFNDFKITG